MLFSTLHKVLFCYLVVFQYLLCTKHANAYIEYNAEIMFSARNSEEGKEGELFVVKDRDVFVRTIKDNVFYYSVPKDGTYSLDCGAIVSTENGKIINLGGKYYTIANEDLMTTSKYKDEFFNESSLECDVQKFDIINKVFVREEEIDGFQTQLYLPDYYDLLKLILYRDANDKGQKTKAFVMSEKNDIGCVFYREYQIYKTPIEKEDGKRKKKTKKKKIVAKTEREFWKQVSTESYKKMMLEDYVYLQPFLNGDINRIVLHVEDTEVKYINAMAIDFEWKKLSLSDLWEKKVVKEYDDGSDKKKKKNNNVKNGNIPNKKTKRNK